MMKALAKLHKTQGIWMTETDIPTVGPNDLCIKIKRQPSVVQTCTFINGMSGRKMRSPCPWLWDMNT